jgi:hypothetical protein
MLWIGIIPILLTHAPSCLASPENTKEAEPTLTRMVQEANAPQPLGERLPSSDWEDFRLTARHVGSRFAHPGGRDLMLFAGIVAGSAWLQHNKLELATDAQELRTPERDRFAGTVRPLGEAAVPVAALSTWLIGKMTGQERMRQAGLILTESATFTVAATELLQFVFSEQRPADGGDLRYFRPGGHGVSGHTSIVASLSVPLDRMFFRLKPGEPGGVRFGKLLGKTLVYAAPIATGWSRVNDDKHYAWNVVAGLGVGFMMGDFVMSAHEPADDAAPSARPWRIVPITGDRGGVGVGVAFTP